MKMKVMTKIISFSDNKKEEKESVQRLLISINVFGSAGPIRFVVKGDDKAEAVIGTALKLYGREGRLPLLGSDAAAFSLYPAAVDAAMESWETIGSTGARNFVLCKMQSGPVMSEARNDAVARGRHGGGWRVWLHKSLTLNIRAH